MVRGARGACVGGGPKTELHSLALDSRRSTVYMADPVAAPDDDVLTAPARVVPRKLALRVSGARLGSNVRPTTPGVVAVSPTHRFGLRVHSSALAPRPAAVPSPASCDYATAEDYE